MADVLYFFKRWLKRPNVVGSLFPSSKYLARAMCGRIDNPHQVKVVELGPGTGSITRRLLEIGVQPQNLALVEIDPEMCKMLKQQFPMLTIHCGDAKNIINFLPSDWIGNVDFVISGLPLINIPRHIRLSILKECSSILSNDGEFIQFTYSPVVVVSKKDIPVNVKLLSVVFRNLPPATVWSLKFCAHCDS